VGANGAGKTNLLEGVHVATQGFSPRTRSEGRLVRLGSEAARASAHATASGAHVETSVTLRRSGPKDVLLNGAPASLDSLRCRLPVLVFLPDRLAVVKGAPAVRRTYFDRMLGRVMPEASTLPGNYAKALSQRAAALRRVRDGHAERESVEPWTEALAELGHELDTARSDLVVELSTRFADSCETLGLSGARAIYEPAEATRAVLEDRLARDIERGTTGAGPHLRDFVLTSDAGDLRAFGSQGQQRVAVLALLLAEAACLRERDRPPALLLDDVLSELDRERRSALVSLLAGATQTLVTATDTDDILDATCVVEVTPGFARVA